MRKPARTGRIPRFVAVFATLFALTSLSSAQLARGESASLQTLDIRLQQELNRARDKWNQKRASVDPRGFPGITFAYVLPDGRSGAVAVGYADLERKTNLQPDDRMLAG